MSASQTPRRINLGLQGGGAHGAFTWGVLDRLLRAEDIEIVAISGTSAGALNGAALKAGMIHGGRQGARDNLDWMWSRIGAISDLRLASWISELSPGTAQLTRALERLMPYSLGAAMSQVFSPYSYGPFYRNPLAPIVQEFRYDKVCSEKGPKLFVGATNVRTGRVKIFAGEAITPEAILASACLPTLFKAIEIPEDDRVEAYWDGGYTANPALFPLFEAGLPQDIVVVNINPIERDGIPYSVQEISTRINEISFNSSLLRELRSIEMVQRMIRDGDVPDSVFKPVLLHMIADDAIMTELGSVTKALPSPVIIGRLKLAGQAAADRFLSAHHADLGRNSTIDLDAMFG